MASFLRYWLPVLLYIALIFTISSIEGLAPPIGIEVSDKLAHAAEYGMLGFLLVRALRGSGTLESTIPAAVVAIFCGLVVGLADEIYQSHVPGRESDPADYAADAAGLVVSAIVFLMLRVVQRARARHA